MVRGQGEKAGRWPGRALNTLLRFGVRRPCLQPSRLFAFSPSEPHPPLSPTHSQVVTMDYQLFLSTESKSRKPSPLKALNLKVRRPSSPFPDPSDA